MNSATPAKRPVCYVGIDPGKTGSIAALAQGRVIAAEGFKDLSRVDTLRLIRDTVSGALSEFEVHVWVEHITPIPGFQAHTLFSLGASSERIACALELVRGSFTTHKVKPTDWTKALEVQSTSTTRRKRSKKTKQEAFEQTLDDWASKKTEKKEAQIAKAKELFPGVVIRKTGKRDVSASLLIAEYGRRQALKGQP